MEITKENVDYDRIYRLNKSNYEDLRSFSFNGIRVLYEPHIKEIYNDIIKGKAVWMAPVEVNINTMGVCDGQHRVKAVLKAWEDGYDYELGVIFRDIPEETEAETVVRKNTTTKNWTQKDFKHKLLLEGNKNAKRLNDFCLNHELLHGKKKKDGTVPTKDRYAMALLRGQNITNEIINGNVVITDDDVEFGEQLYEEVKALYDVLGYQSKGGGWYEYFLQGWYEFRSNNKYCKRVEKVGLDKYIESMPVLFENEKIMSKAVYVDRFVAVLIELEKKRH